MYLIPQSWSHVHILVGVFPTVGLLFVLAFYAAGIKTGNEVLRRLCLLILIGVGALGIPTYMSAVGSVADLTGNARYAPAAIELHRLWGMITFGFLGLLSLVSLLELFWAISQGRGARDPRWLVRGVGLVALGLSGWASELGFWINHNELKLSITIPEVSTSQVWSHVHMMLNHIPTAGFIFALAFFILGVLSNNHGMKRGSLVAIVICCIVGVPTYVAGTATMWALAQPTIPEISKAVINSHRDMALATLISMAFTGGAAWLELWRARAAGRISYWSLFGIFLLSLGTLAAMTETGHRGGLINHPEIRTALDVLPTDPNAGISEQLETIMKDMIWFVPWQTVHFFGYCLIFGSAFAVMLRVLGVWKSVSYAAMHRVLVIGFIGVLMNVVSGMLMMFADSYRYVVTYGPFAPKIALLTLGSIAAIYFSVSDRVWNVQVGQRAPMSAKWMAIVVLLAWAGVIVCGRLLPFI